jgi:vWA-MoxR associated protein middle region (VMAP-M) 2
MKAPRRHLLVLAPQCRAKPQLDRLKDAARELDQVLTDSEIGGCAPGLPDGRSLISGKLSSDDLMARVKEAVRHASEKEATLILALLGHGFTSGNASMLYLMADESDEARPMDAVEVGKLLRDAASTPGINGVIGIVDTCFALNAQPQVQDLASGMRGANTRLSLLMASSATEPAHDLRFSLGLATLLREGLEGKGPRLQAGDVAYELRSRVTGQTIPWLVYDADRFAVLPLWLAYNAKYDDGPESLLGPKGGQELDAAWGAVHPGSPAYDGPWDTYALRDLESALAHNDGSEPWRRAERAATNADIAHKTVKFLRLKLEHELTTTRIRRALVALWADTDWLSPIPSWLVDIDVVDYVAFCHPDFHPDCREWMATFVWLLVSDAGVEADDLDLRRWARAVDARQFLNDAVESVKEIRRRQALRLVIYLVSPTGDWPQTLDAWLFWGEKLCNHALFECQPVDKLGTEEALRKALDWAKALGAAQGPDSEHMPGGIGLRFRRVDIVAHAALLLTWRPEMVAVRHGRLGHQHDVVTHWSRRFESDDWFVQEIADDRLRETNRRGPKARVDWITEPDAREHVSLRERLENYTSGAVGLVNHPGTDVALIELLLYHIPIVLWPQTESGFPAERHGSVEACWWLLPWGFQRAYRKRWAGKDLGDLDGLADLCAVWDDQDWLDFCRRFRREAGDQRAHRERP